MLDSFNSANLAPLYPPVPQFSLASGIIGVPLPSTPFLNLCPTHSTELFPRQVLVVYPLSTSELAVSPLWRVLADHSWLLA